MQGEKREDKTGIVALGTTCVSARGRERHAPNIALPLPRPWLLVAFRAGAATTTLITQSQSQWMSRIDVLPKFRYKYSSSRQTAGLRIGMRQIL